MNDETPSPKLLRAAPELAAAGLLDQVTRVLAAALVAVHPDLEERAEPREPPTLNKARALLAAIGRLRGALVRYQDAVHRDLHDVDGEVDDLPF